MKRWFEKLPRWSGNHPFGVLAIIAFASLLAIIVLPRLKLKGDIYEMFPERSGPIASLAQYGKWFGSKQKLVVLITGAEMTRVNQATHLMAAALRQSPLVKQIQTGIDGKALHAFLSRHWVALASKEARKRIDKRLTDGLSGQLAKLRRLLLMPVPPPTEYIARDPLQLVELLWARHGGGGAFGIDTQTGLFSSPKKNATLIFVEPKQPHPTLEVCEELDHFLQAIRQKVLRRVNDPKLKIRFTGEYQYTLYFARTIKHDLTLSSTLTIACVVLVFMLFFRSLWLIPTATLLSGITILWTLGIAAVSVGRLHGLSLSFAALCIGMGIDALMHITVRAGHAREGSIHARWVGSIQSLLPSLLSATFTTMVAFCTFTVSSFRGLRDLGWLTACGVGITMLLTLLMVPAVARLCKLSFKRSHTIGIEYLLTRLVNLLHRRWRLLLLIFIGLTSFSVLKARKISFSHDLLRLAPKSLPPMQTDLAIAKVFEQKEQRLILMIRSHDAQKALEANDRLAHYFEEQQRNGKIGQFYSLSALLPSIKEQKARWRYFEKTSGLKMDEKISRAMDKANLNTAAFAPFFSSFSNDEMFSYAQLPVTLKPLIQRQWLQDQQKTVIASIIYPSSGETTFVQSLERKINQFSSSDVDVRLTGVRLAGREMSQLLRKDLLLLSGIAFLGVCLALMIVIRRWWNIAATLLSMLCGALLFLGTLAYFGVNIDLYNLMVFPLLIGFGIEVHIYVMRQAQVEGLGKAFVESGLAVLATTLTTSIGFAALGICDLPGLKRLALTGVLGLLFELVSALCILPVLILALKRVCPNPRKDTSCS